MSDAIKFKFYAYKTSISFKGDLYQPGQEIPAEVVRNIPRANVRTLLKEGVLITENQKNALEEAQRLNDAQQADLLPPIGCGANEYMDELRLTHGSTAGLGQARKDLKDSRGEAPLREIEDFLDGNAETEEFVDDPEVPEVQEVEAVGLPPLQELSDFVDDSDDDLDSVYDYDELDQEEDV